MYWILWRVCVVDGWFTASPGLSQTDWTLAGWGCTPGVHEQSWHPRINQPSTHTLEEEPQSWPVHHQLGEYHQPVNSNKYLLYYIYPCPVSEEPKESHFGGVWRSNPATLAPNVGLLRPGRDTEGLSQLHWSHQPRRRTATPAPAPPERQRRPAEERGGSTATATGNHCC